MRLAKVIAWTVVSFCGLVLILASIIQWIDWNQYRDAVAQQISKAIDRPVSISEGLSVHLFPSIRLDIKGLVVGNPAGNDQKDFLTVENARLELDMRALTEGQLLIREISLESPILQLGVDSHDSSNWESGRGLTVPVLPLPVSQVSVVGGTLTLGSGGEVDRWEIEADTLVYVLPREDLHKKGQINGQLSYAGNVVEVTGVLGSINGLVSDQLAPINLMFTGKDVSGSVSGVVTNLRQAPNANLHLDVSMGRFASNLTDLLPGLPWQDDTNLGGTVKATGHLVGNPGRDLRLESVRLSTTELPLNFTAQGDLDLVPANVRLNHSMGDLHVRLKNQSLQKLAALMSIDVPTNIRVSGQAMLSGKPSNFRLEQLMLIGESPHLGIRLTGNVSQLGSPSGPDLALNFDTTSDTLTELLRQFKLEMPLHGSAHMMGVLRGSNKGYRLSELSASFDTQDLTLEGTGQFDQLQTGLEGQFEFIAKSGSIQSLADRLGRKLPIDATAIGRGMLTCANGRCGIEVENLAINSPLLDISGAGQIESIEEQLQLSLKFKGNTKDVAALTQAWGSQLPVPLHLETSVTGWLDVDGNDARLSSLVGQISGDGLSGRLTGSLANLLDDPRPMWDLNLNVTKLGHLIEYYGGSGDYHESAQIQLQVRHSNNKALPFIAKGKLLTNSLVAQLAGSLEKFDINSRFSAEVMLTADGPHELREIIGVDLPPMGRLQATGQVFRETNSQESTRVSVNLQSEKLGRLSAEGVWGEQWNNGSKLDMKFAVDQVSKLSALSSFSFQGETPLQAQARVTTNGEMLLVKDIKVKAGRNDISGEISYLLSENDGDRQKIKGRLASKYLNLNDLFPKKEKKYLFGNERIPLDWAHHTDVDLEFVADHLFRRKYKVTDVALNVHSLNGLVNFQLQGISAGGDLEVQLDFDTQAVPHPANYFYDWKHLDLDLLPPGLKGSLNVSGVLSTQGYLAGAGRTLHEIAQSGSGYLVTDLESIKFPRGREELLATTPLNIAGQILREVSPWAERKKFYDIKCGVIGMQIKDGVGHSAAPPRHTIAIKAEEFELSAFGDLDLSEENLELSVRSKPRRERISLDSLLDQSGLSLLYPPYYRIEGKLRRPIAAPDPDGRNLLERLKFEDADILSSLKLGAALATGGTSAVVFSLLDQLDDEGGGCPGARRRSQLLREQYDQ